MSNDFTLFLGQVLRNPRQISAIFPSSDALCEAMVREIDLGLGPVAEFGPGTGRITRYILSKGVARRDLTLFETNRTFCDALALTFPGVDIVNAPAQSILARGNGTFGTIISGLPLLSMPEEVRQDIAAAAFAALKPGGIFVQFTYGRKSPLPQPLLESIGFEGSSGRLVWSNLPPARVFRFHRPTGLSRAA